jgi:hypothetical protein
MRIRRILLIFILISPTLTLTHCGLIEKGKHNAGKNCMWVGCHGYDAASWQYAGTVFSSPDGSSAAKGVTVTIVDVTGERTLKTNSVGNFYTREGAPSKGFRATISKGEGTRRMDSEPASGACNSCHSPDGAVPPLHID